ncbi:MAG: periplasmic heavy metal sensor [Deltaproteobacteria bacterium]|nr:periplasmic heavy metal sensor [Deltaproteobacteria bacterium]
MKKRMKQLTIVAFVVVIGAAPFAFARGWFEGNRYGGHMMDRGWGGHMMGPGYGGNMMGYGPRGGWGDGEDLGLSRNQAEQLEKTREAFYREIRDLQERIYNKSVELRRELAKENPDRNRISALQRELSGLESEFDQKRLDHELELRKIAPEIGGRFEGGYGPGTGWCWR